LHINFRYDEAGILQHRLHRQHIGMACTPREGFHAHIDVLRPCMGSLQNRRHLEAGACVTVILHRNLRMAFPDVLNDLADACRAAYACHIFHTDFVGSHLNQRIGQRGIIFNRMHGRDGEAKGRLGDHPRFPGKPDGVLQVAWIV
jgi:hypothetical protein